MVAVSACLAGIPCRYNGTSVNAPELQKIISAVPVLPVCPELLGGLKTPREPAEIMGGDGLGVLEGKAWVCTAEGQNVTAYYVKGAAMTLQHLVDKKIQVMVMKEKSPSCGVKCIYDGSFTRTLKPGCGVTTALLKSNNITVMSEFEDSLLYKWIHQQERVKRNDK